MSRQANMDDETRALYVEQEHYQLLQAPHSATNGEECDEDQSKNNGCNNHLHFHVLIPHLSPYFSTLGLEILCLSRGFSDSRQIALANTEYF